MTTAPIPHYITAPKPLDRTKPLHLALAGGAGHLVHEKVLALLNRAAKLAPSLTLYCGPRAQGVDPIAYGWARHRPEVTLRIFPEAIGKRAVTSDHDIARDLVRALDAARTPETAAMLVLYPSTEAAALLPFLVHARAVHKLDIRYGDPSLYQTPAHV